MSEIMDWDIGATTAYITQRGFKKVGLQFPDDLLPHSPSVFRMLEKELDPSVKVCYP
jgi:diphthamide biosynthesis enzyme Dph1/Dph2-like protein